MDSRDDAGRVRRRLEHRDVARGCGRTCGPSRQSDDSLDDEGVTDRGEREWRNALELLVGGKIDALMAPSMPFKFGQDDAVRRLFEDHAELERDYFRRTGVFPIMHVVALRRDRYEAHPFIARSLYDAFERSKELAYEALEEVGAPRAVLPQLDSYWEETKRIFGSDPWPYGIERNRPTLEAWVRYLHQDGLTPRLLTIEELFVG